VATAANVTSRAGMVVLESSSSPSASSLTSPFWRSILC